MTRRTLIVIDLQNEYLPTGRLPLAGIDAAVANAAAALGHARCIGIPVIHVRHESASADAPIFVPGTDNVAILPAVAPQGDEPVVVKHHVNAFRDTDLKGHLDALGTEELVVLGAMSHMCVQSCARAAADMGYRVTVLHDACATLDLTFDGVTTPAAQVHAASMASLAFAFAAVEPTAWFAAD